MVESTIGQLNDAEDHGKKTYEDDSLFWPE